MVQESEDEKEYIDEVAVIGVAGIEGREGHREHVLVEVTSSEQSDGLQGLHFCQQRGGVEDRTEIVRLILDEDGHPVELVLDDRAIVSDDGRSEGVSRCRVDDAGRRYGQLGGELAVVVDPFGERFGLGLRPVLFPG